MVDTAGYVSRLREIGPAAWAEGPYGWIDEDGKPIILTGWQKAVLNAWWLFRFDITTLAISNVKKTGKTLLDAILLCWRFLALPGVHFAVGNDLDQSTARQFGMIADMIKRNPYLSQVVKVTGREMRFRPTGSVLSALAVDAAGNAGANHLTASHTEAWGIIYEAGIRAYEELTPPPNKAGGLPALRICDSYAGYEGESKVWHGIVDRGLKGERVSEEWPIYRAGGLLLFHMEGEEARRRCFRGTPQEAERYYTDQQATLRPNAFSRMHANMRTSGEGAFVSPEEWEACYSPEVVPLSSNVPGDNRQVVLGADASTSRDLTSLIGCVYNPETKASEVVYVRVWKPQPDAGRMGKPTIDLEGIKGEIARLHKEGRVAAVYFDPYQLHSIAMDLRKQGVRMIELPQTTGRIEADQALYDAIIARTIRHYGDPTLTEHVRNAVAIETPRGFRLAKEKAALKIDAAVALSMAHYGSRKHSPVKRKATQHQGYSGLGSDNTIRIPWIIE